MNSMPLIARVAFGLLLYAICIPWCAAILIYWAFTAPFRPKPQVYRHELTGLPCGAGDDNA